METKEGNAEELAKLLNQQVIHLNEIVLKSKLPKWRELAFWLSATYYDCYPQTFSSLSNSNAFYIDKDNNVLYRIDLSRFKLVDTVYINLLTGVFTGPKEMLSLPIVPDVQSLIDIAKLSASAKNSYGKLYIVDLKGFLNRYSIPYTEELLNELKEL